MSGQPVIPGRCSGSAPRRFAKKRIFRQGCFSRRFCRMKPPHTSSPSGGKGFADLITDSFSYNIRQRKYNILPLLCKENAAIMGVKRRKRQKQKKGEYHNSQRKTECGAAGRPSRAHQLDGGRFHRGGMPRHLRIRENRPSGDHPVSAALSRKARTEHFSKEAFYVRTVCGSGFSGR